MWLENGVIWNGYFSNELFLGRIISPFLSTEALESSKCDGMYRLLPSIVRYRSHRDFIADITEGESGATCKIYTSKYRKLKVQMIQYRRYTYYGTPKMKY